VSDAEYLAVLGLIFGIAEGSQVLAKYPPPLFGDKRPLMSRLGTEYIFTCPTRNSTDNMANFNVPGVYAFYVCLEYVTSVVVFLTNPNAV